MAAVQDLRETNSRPSGMAETPVTARTHFLSTLHPATQMVSLRGLEQLAGNIVRRHTRLSISRPLSGLMPQSNYPYAESSTLPLRGLTEQDPELRTDLPPTDIGSPMISGQPDTSGQQVIDPQWGRSLTSSIQPARGEAAPAAANTLSSEPLPEDFTGFTDERPSYAAEIRRRIQASTAARSTNIPLHNLASGASNTLVNPMPGTLSTSSATVPSIAAEIRRRIQRAALERPIGDADIVASAPETDNQSDLEIESADEPTVTPFPHSSATTNLRERVRQVRREGNQPIQRKRRAYSQVEVLSTRHSGTDDYPTAQSAPEPSTTGAIQRQASPADDDPIDVNPSTTLDAVQAEGSIQRSVVIPEPSIQRIPTPSSLPSEAVAPNLATKPLSSSSDQGIIDASAESIVGQSAAALKDTLSAPKHPADLQLDRRAQDEEDPPASIEQTISSPPSHAQQLPNPDRPMSQQATPERTLQRKPDSSLPVAEANRTAQATSADGQTNRFVRDSMGPDTEMPPPTVSSNILSAASRVVPPTDQTPDISRALVNDEPENFSVPESLLPESLLSGSGSTILDQAINPDRVDDIVGDLSLNASTKIGTIGTQSTPSAADPLPNVPVQRTILDNDQRSATFGALPFAALPGTATQAVVDLTATPMAEPNSAVGLKQATQAAHESVFVRSMQPVQLLSQQLTVLPQLQRRSTIEGHTQRAQKPEEPSRGQLPAMLSRSGSQPLPALHGHVTGANATSDISISSTDSFDSEADSRILQFATSYPQVQQTPSEFVVTNYTDREEQSVPGTVDTATVTHPYRSHEEPQMAQRHGFHAQYTPPELELAVAAPDVSGRLQRARTESSAMVATSPVVNQPISAQADEPQLIDLAITSADSADEKNAAPKFDLHSLARQILPLIKRMVAVDRERMP